jgi:hypothetical protein
VSPPRHLLAIVTDALEGPEQVEEIGRQANGDGVEVRLIAPAVEATAFRHTMGDIDEPKREAEERLRVSLDTLRGSGISASGEVGDPDPVQAAQDALLEVPADEVLIFERAESQARWFESDLFSKAQETLEPPLRLVAIETDEDDSTHVVDIEKVGRGTMQPDESDEVGSAYLPGLSRGDLASIAIGIVGTIVAIVLAAATGSGTGPESGWKAVAIGIAIAIALINMAHVVALTLFEAVRYRGGFAKFFRTLSLLGTPLAVLANLLILLFT